MKRHIPALVCLMLFYLLVNACAMPERPSTVLTPVFSPTPPPYPLPATPTPRPTVVSTIAPTPFGTPTRVVFPTPMPPEPNENLGTVREVTSTMALRSALALDGNYVVWRSFALSQTHVIAYNLATGTEKRISSLLGGKTDLRIAGNYVVWEETLDQPGKFTAAHVYDLAANQESELSSSAYTQSSPDVAGDIVVSVDTFISTGIRKGGLYGYNLKTREQFPIDDSPGRHDYPRIGGNWVVYLDWQPTQNPATDQPTLRARNLRTGENLALGQTEFFKTGRVRSMHAISGNRVVWVWDRGINIYDLSTRQSRRITTPSIFDGFRGNWLNIGSRIWNIENGAWVDYFKPERDGRLSAVSEIVTDGRNLAWMYNQNNQGRIFVAPLLRAP